MNCYYSHVFEYRTLAYTSMGSNQYAISTANYNIVNIIMHIMYICFREIQGNIIIQSHKLCTYASMYMYMPA